MNQEVGPGVGSPVLPADGSVDRGDPRSPREHITALVEEMLMYRADPGVTYAFFRLPNLAPQDLITRFREETSLELLVPDGKEMPQPSEDNTIRLADPSKLTGVMVTTGRAKEGNYRRRKIAVEFLSGYKEGDRITKASQALVLEDDSKEPVRITVQRLASVDLNSDELGFLPSVPAPVSDEQVAAFLGIVKEMFEDWKKSPEGIDRVKRGHVAARLSKTSRK